MNILWIEFLNKSYFFLLLLIPFFLYFYYKKQKKFIYLKTFWDLKNTKNKKNILFYVNILFLILCIFWYSLILSNPNTSSSTQKIEKNWIDIVIAYDVSISMWAWDIKPNRMEAAKEVISNFAWKLQTDRLWLVVFAWKPFTSLPLTFDYKIVQDYIKNLSIETIDQTTPGLAWTWIWDALIMAKNMFKKPKEMKDDEYKKRQKVVILLTDWDANTWVDPNIAAKYLVEENIKIYTIWIWWEKDTSFTATIKNQKLMFEIKPLNKDALKEIANIWKWEFFYAQDKETLEQIFLKLQILEKQKITINKQKLYSTFYDIFMLFLWLNLFIFCFLNFKNIDYANNKS